MQVEHALRMHLAASGVPYRCVDHPACRTSEESARARSVAGAPGAVGAKALVVVAKSGFALLVIPGTCRLDSRKARSVIGKFRFADADEVRAATGGLEIGTIPPFGRPVLPGIERLVVDDRIGAEADIGFNAGCLTRSIIMSGADYIGIAQPTAVTDLTEALGDVRRAADAA